VFMGTHRRSQAYVGVFKEEAVRSVIQERYPQRAAKRGHISLQALKE